MPKMKTNSGAKKRLKVTGSGKLKRKTAFRNHMLEKKSPGRKSRLGKSTLVSKADTPRLKKLLCI